VVLGTEREAFAAAVEGVKVVAGAGFKVWDDDAEDTTGGQDAFALADEAACDGGREVFEEVGVVCRGGRGVGERDGVDEVGASDTGNDGV
jgi:hypothetical protein